MPSRTDSNTTCSCSVAIGLIDIQTVDQPGSVCESRGVVLHVIVAAIGKGGAVGAIAPNISGPVAAEVCIQDLAGGGSISGLVVARRKRGSGRKEVKCESRCRRKSGRTIDMFAKWLGILQSP